MGFFDTFKSTQWLSGTVTINRLPEHIAIIVHALILPAKSVSEAPSGDIQDYKEFCIKEDDQKEEWPLPFAIQRPKGLYYVGLSVIAFIRQDGKIFAQVERFFPMKHPAQSSADKQQSIILAVQWPDIPLNQLGSYGKMHPQ